MTTDPSGLLAATIAALEQMPPHQRAIAAAEFIAAVQGPEDRRISRLRWAAITELHEGGMTMAQIADQIGSSEGAVDLALQSHRRASTVSA